MKQERRPHTHDRSGEQARAEVERLASKHVNASKYAEIVKEIKRLGGEDVMAQEPSESCKRQRVETAVQRSFHRKPRTQSVGMQFVCQVARECSISFTVDSEA